jgi:hypothetical protein
MADFTGDLTEEQVEITLEKFLEVVNENHELKYHALEKDPWRNWVHFAHMIDAFRVFPRVFFGVYIILLAYSGIWFMALTAPLAAQSAFISTVWAAGAAWFGLYVNSGWKHGQKG